MQTDNRVFDSMARFFTNAAGAAQAFGSEVETMLKGRFERFVADMDFVPRDEFETVKAMAAKARTENEKLARRVAALEEQVHKPASSSEAVGHKKNPSTATSQKAHRPKL
jgi:BMFP domain-containing protein YqiC